jgi:L-ascorbate metabolism protein UlaG (beta-lactamase superfamily)
MKLKWYGHASFRLTTADGIGIVTDPYDPATSGYKPVLEPADLVVMSSDNDSFHCNAHLIPGAHVTVNTLEVARSGMARIEHGVRLTAIEAMEAHDHREHDPDQNAIYRLEVDGLSIGHMGDVGNALNDVQLEFLNNVDVLLALAGGHPTIELEDLMTVIRAVKPKVVVPMHFRTLTYKPRNSLWIASFLEHFPDAAVNFACNCEVELTKDQLPLETRVLVLDHA